MNQIEIGDQVEIMEHVAGGRWTWKDENGKTRTGLVTTIDDHCLGVRRDDTGEHIRDVREHFRKVQS